MLNQLKTLTLGTPPLDELVSMAAFGKSLRAEFEAHNIDVPEWLDNRLRDLKREIRTRTEESVEKRKAEIRARMEALQTPGERKAALQAELDKLEGKSTPAPVTA